MPRKEKNKGSQRPGGESGAGSFVSFVEVQRVKSTQSSQCPLEVTNRVANEKLCASLAQENLKPVEGCLAIRPFSYFIVKAKYDW